MSLSKTRAAQQQYSQEASIETLTPHSPNEHTILTH